MPDVQVDERVELLSIIFRLAGAPEYSTRRIPAYADAIDAHFGSLRDHQAVLAAKKLREEHGISHDAVAVLAIQLGPLPQLSERGPFDQAQLGDRWKPDMARSFLAQVRAFAAESNAAAFFQQQRPLYRVAERRMRTLIASETDLRWIQEYYGGSPGEKFIIVPALGNGTFFYGPRFAATGLEPEFYAVMTAWQTDEDGRPVFDVSTAYTVLHEFGHSYVNPLILDRYQDLRSVGDALLRTVGSDMAAHGYTRGATILYESIIRAAVARYKLANIDEATARRELDRQRRLGFIWIDELYDLLGTYEQNRNRYPTFADFYPAVRDYFAGLEPRLPALAAAYEARRPHVMQVSPENGAEAVDPGTTSLTVRLDKPVRTYGFNPGPNNRHWPITGASMDDSRTLVTLNVRLRPNTSYEIILIPSQFTTDEGEPISPYTWRFTTGPGRRE